jgi:hypothetical protein
MCAHMCAAVVVRLLRLVKSLPCAWRAPAPGELAQSKGQSGHGRQVLHVGTTSHVLPL